MKKEIILTMAFGVIVASMMIWLATPQAEAAPPVLSEYPVGGSPLNVAVESPGHIWFTAPNQNWIGKLVVTSTVEYQVITFTVPTLASEPYDLKLVSGKIYFTERLGNQIGLLDPSTGVFHEYVIPTSSSEPTGIDVLAGAPTQVWFTERSGNKLGKLVITNTIDYTFTEYALPTGYSNAQPEDIEVHGTDNIWFTAPISFGLGAFWPNTQAFEMLYTGSSASQPWSVKTDASGNPWMTERAGNRIGEFVASTISMFRWTNLPLANSDPYDLAITGGAVWFTEQNTDRIGRFDPTAHTLQELGLGNSSGPRGIDADSNNCLWIAESGRNRVASWCAPYFYLTYLPIISK